MSSSEPQLLVIGGVAAGAAAAGRARRLHSSARITIVERGPYMSYANCGLPYYISRDISDRGKLLVATPEGFKRRYNIDVHLNTEAVTIDRTNRRVQVMHGNELSWLSYDALILAQGGRPVRPTLPGSDADHVFTLWTVPDMDALDHFIVSETPRTAVIVGGGFIGLEMAEAFHARGIATTVVELQPTVMSVMDPEFGEMVASELVSKGVGVITGVAVSEVRSNPHEVLLSDGRSLSADLVLFSVGVKPELTLARSCGLEIGVSGGLVVDKWLRTSDPNIFAAGDMIELRNFVSGKPTRVPLAGPANRQGRIAAENVASLLRGESAEVLSYAGALGTSVVKVLDATAALTGLGERAASEAGFDVGVALVEASDHASYYPGARKLKLKIVYDRQSERLLGAQAFGAAGVDKRIDVLATALRGRLTVHDLAELDLGYAPPYSTTNDIINTAAFVAQKDQYERRSSAATTSSSGSLRSISSVESTA